MKLCSAAGTVWGFHVLMYIGDKVLGHSNGARPVHIALCGNSSNWHFIVIMKLNVSRGKLE